MTLTVKNLRWVTDVLHSKRNTLQQLFKCSGHPGICLFVDCDMSVVDLLKNIRKKFNDEGTFKRR